MIIRHPTFARSSVTRPGSHALVLALLALATAVPACADAPLPPAATPVTEADAPAAKPLPPLPRSSIAAVVQHRGELGLSDEQIEAMERRDREREEEDRALRSEDEKRRKAVEEAASNARNAAPPGRSPGSGMRGGGMGGGRRGVGMGGPGGGAASGGRTAQGESFEDRLDADDTKAYLDIEDVLTPDQRAPAREIASDYRAQLYDRRQQKGGARSR
jgi:hypothetical protein